jgi:hypothetical protein
MIVSGVCIHNLSLLSLLIMLICYSATRKLFHQAVTNHAVTRPNIIVAVRHLLQRLLNTSEDYAQEFRLCV